MDPTEYARIPTPFISFGFVKSVRSVNRDSEGEPGFFPGLRSGIALNSLFCPPATLFMPISGAASLFEQHSVQRSAGPYLWAG